MLKSILVYSNQIGTKQLVHRLFKQSHIKVEYHYSKSIILKCLDQNATDLLLIDTQGHDDEGYELIESVRAGQHDLPILVCCPLQGDYAVIALQLGADDYMVKPVHSMELKERILNLCTRYQMTQPARRQSMDSFENTFFINPMTDDIYKHDQLLELTMIERSLLRYFLHNPNTTLSKEEIYLHVWKNQLVSPNSVMVYIRYLREKIEADPKNPEYIRTVRGEGYRFYL